VNRQTKRSLQGQGSPGSSAPPPPSADGQLAQPLDRRGLDVRSPEHSDHAERGSHHNEPSRANLAGRLARYLREVRAELAKVLWPKRSEIINYSTVVLTTLVLIALLIFGLNYLFARGVSFLFRS